jgi:NAD(P)-dependent dehydrogenase (short-subunit alcohol dehydrogenase family)
MTKNLLITGGAGGLGQAVVKKFVAEGYHLIATVEKGTQLPQTDNIDVYELDATNESDCRKFVKDITEKYKTIDAAILLAGGFAMGGFAETDGEALEKMYKINFLTAYFLAQPVFEHMLTQSEGGKIIFIGARPALQAEAGKNMVAYSLSKSLIFKLSELMNAAGKSKNVTTTVIVPSTIDTPANRKAMPDADTNKWVKPEDLAALMAFVCSETGSILRENVLKAYNES